MPGHKIPRHGLVYVPQNDNVFKRLSVRENLEVGGFAAKGDTSVRMAEILEIFTDLGKATEKKAGFLSGGQQNLLAIARALMVDPAVIVLDEPTAGLSPAYTDVVWNQIARISQLDTAVLVVEQNVERALKHSDYRPCLRGGPEPRPRTGDARSPRSTSRRSSSDGRTPS